MAWELTGNAGTDPTKDFLGTTDGQPLVLKVNGVEHVRLDTGGNVGFGTEQPADPDPHREQHGRCKDPV